MATMKARAESVKTADRDRQRGVGGSASPLGADVEAYHAALPAGDRATCAVLSQEINSALADADSKVWHGSPVWFLDGNPIVGYGKLKGCVRLLFWSGQSFEEPGLVPEGSFKAAEARYLTVDDVDRAALRRWLHTARSVQWDYKNIVKRKGRLERLATEQIDQRSKTSSRNAWP